MLDFSKGSTRASETLGSEDSFRTAHFSGGIVTEEVGDFINEFFYFSVFSMETVKTSENDKICGFPNEKDTI